ncbi:hypothetical protein OK351_03020 [Glutamicibacter sp. MNS18]|uniref:hypothetical protein n=1 Tax=Glutamicibacter sp. MNS18 TaxID=2989817 RepID=UPI0022365FDC|nr:hypothetical protein [Glutamicibacter sp. MNS18]MCW4464483.1 hypothetical protein [Glutamicibacter sp. MNS18]
MSRAAGAEPGLLLEQLAHHERRLGFKPQPAVRWLSPPQLIRTGLQALAAHTIAGYLDNRETQAALPQGLLDLAGEEPQSRWIDYVADLGDGFDATYTIASLLAQPRLAVRGPGQPATVLPQPLPRGSLLVMGGDQVYPSASSRAYEDRLIGPYRAACGSDPPTGARLLALPGNHDWYDGLGSFLRVFGQNANIGHWQTWQSRGYFAARLARFGPMRANSWWLIGLDSELGSYIDRPQLEYFEREVSSQLRPGDALIVCTATPTWAATAGAPAPDPEANNSLHYFENHYLLRRHTADGTGTEPTGARIRLRLSGDKHHYCRYVEQHPGARPDDPRAEQLVTCGLGGAYLMATDQLAGQLILPSPESRLPHPEAGRIGYRLAGARFPDAPQARKRYLQLLALPGRYGLLRRNPWFGFALGSVHLALFILLTTVLSVLTGDSLIELIGSGRAGDALWLLGYFYLLPMLLLGVLPRFGLLPLPRRGPPTAPPRDPQPMLLLAGQLLVSAALFLLVLAQPVTHPLPDRVEALVLAVTIWTLGYLAGSLVFAAQLVLATPGEVGKLKMTGLAYEGGKGFIRIRLDPDGTLTLYPLLTEQVVHRWELEELPGTLVGSPGSVRPVPATSLPVMHLLEAPVVISPEGFAAPEGA